MRNQLVDIIEIRQLVNQAENLVEIIGRLMPVGEQAWLEWRHKGMVRKLADAKRELNKVTELVQQQLYADAAQRRRAERC
jgi:hypothetical protein